VSEYWRLLRVPGAARFVLAGFVGRMPISMLTLGVVLLVTAHGGNYALAGALTASFALAQAFIAPLGLRWADRSGQHRAVPVLAAAESAAIIAFTVSVVRGLPVPVQFAFAVGAGATAPHLGSLVRARWAALFSGRPELGSAFALEAVIDEVVFIVGPPLMTLLALQVGEAFAMYFCVVLILLGGLWLSAQTRTQPQTHPRGGARAIEKMVSPALTVLLLIMLLLGGVFGSFEVTTVAFARSVGSEPLTGVALALYAFGSLIAGLVYGARSPADDAGRRILWFSVYLALIGLPLVLVGSIWTLMLLAFLAGTAIAPLLISTTMIIERVVPAGRLTEALGVSISGLAVGVAVGSTTSGALVDSASANAGYAVMAGCGAGVLVVALGGGRLLRRSTRAPG
jgi:predicted MFS family arabinose efflux permease